MGIIWGLYWVLWGLHRDNGKENGSYHRKFGYACRDYIGTVCNSGESYGKKLENEMANGVHRVDRVSA